MTTGRAGSTMADAGGQSASIGAGAAPGERPAGAPDPASLAAELGRQIRTIRRRRGLTLEEAGERAGITAGYLSQIERGLATPTLMSLKRIADSLSVRLGDLFQDGELASPYGVVRHDRRPSFRHALTGQLHTYLTPTWGGRMIAALYRLAPGEETTTLFHAGEEFVYVLRGELEYRIGQRCSRMGAGDSLYFDASEPHSVANVGQTEAEWIWVTTHGA